MPAPDENLLVPTVAPKPVDLGPEFARLEQLTRDLNKAKHPAIAVPEGVKVNNGEYSADSGADGATTTLNDPIFGSTIPKSGGKTVKETLVLPQSASAPSGASSAVELTPPAVVEPPIPAAPTVSLHRVFFTGRSGVGKSWLAHQMGALEFCIQDPITAVLTEQFGEIKSVPMDLVNLIIQWGEGVITKDIPLTATRLLFQSFAKAQFGEDFGKTGFWARRLIDSALAADGPVAITTVTDAAIFNALKDAGFQHFHVMASNTTVNNRSRRATANNKLAEHLDNQIIKALSLEKNGEKLKAVWCDNVVAPMSNRLFDVGGFLAMARQSSSVSALAE